MLIKNTFQEEGPSQRFKVSTLSKHRTAHHFNLQICVCCFSMYISYFDNDRVFPADFFAC